jgi:hypothetical protein
MRAGTSKAPPGLFLISYSSPNEGEWLARPVAEAGVDVLGLLEAGRLDDALAVSWMTAGEKYDAADRVPWDGKPATTPATNAPCAPTRGRHIPRHLSQSPSPSSGPLRRRRAGATGGLRTGSPTSRATARRPPRKVEPGLQPLAVAASLAVLASDPHHRSATLTPGGQPQPLTTRCGSP